VTLWGCLRLYSPVIVIILWAVLRAVIGVRVVVGTAAMGILAAALVLHTREITHLYKRSRGGH
jgi:hypothetical protein